MSHLKLWLQFVGDVFPQPTLHAPQISEPPKAAPNFVQQTPQYRRYSGAAATSSQTNTGHAGAPGGTTNQGVHNPVRNT